jgi:hypothetical protein
MRDFLYSEIANVHRITNLPDDPQLAIAAGKRLCEELLEPLQATFGRIAIRSAYRSSSVNAYGNVHGYNCASNPRNYARHTWDRRDAQGMGAMACIAVPWLVDRMQSGTTWQAMAGGSMTICLTANFSSFRNSPPSTSAGTKCPNGRSSVTRHRADT